MYDWPAWIDKSRGPAAQSLNLRLGETGVGEQNGALVLLQRGKSDGDGVAAGIGDHLIDRVQLRFHTTQKGKGSIEAARLIAQVAIAPQPGAETNRVKAVRNGSGVIAVPGAC